MCVCLFVCINSPIFLKTERIFFAIFCCFSSLSFSVGVCFLVYVTVVVVAFTVCFENEIQNFYSRCVFVVSCCCFWSSF